MNTLPATITSSLGSVRAFCRAASYAGAVVFRPANHLAPVHCLFGSSRPSTVSRKIPEIVLDAVDGVPNRSLPHVGKKIFKPVPLSANGDASPPIILEPSVFRVATPSKHAHPRQVRRTAPVDGVPMFKRVLIVGCDTNRIGHNGLRQGCCVKWRSSPEPARSPRLYHSISNPSPPRLSTVVCLRPLTADGYSALASPCLARGGGYSQ